MKQKNRRVKGKAKPETGIDREPNLESSSQTETAAPKGLRDRVFDFVGPRKIWYLISMIFIIPGIVSLAIQGLNLGIDFTGGS
ncbi:MAG: hypothetical protein GX295_00885, partial [Syntrophomonadaceae bacterium]|nr:hypothetical protein [Syntrophomonadaceae bacterium]